MPNEQTKGASLTSKAYLPIEDYGVIGDLYTVALVGMNGSIDWCCIPNTNILITRFLTGDGVSEIIDFMPIKHTGSAPSEHHLVRAVRVVNGSLSFEIACRPAFNYARDEHTVQLSRDGVAFHSEDLDLVLSSSIPLEEDGQGGAHARFTLHEGQWAYFFLESASDHALVPHQPTQGEYQDSFVATQRYWHDWISQCRYQGRWREMVQRSALILKLLTYAPTGAIVAAPTTSLPEGIGGVRNWDYRFTWFRDAAFTLNSLINWKATGSLDPCVSAMPPIHKNN